MTEHRIDDRVVAPEPDCNTIIKWGTGAVGEIATALARRYGLEDYKVPEALAILVASWQWVSDVYKTIVGGWKNPQLDHQPIQFVIDSVDRVMIKIHREEERRRAQIASAQRPAASAYPPTPVPAPKVYTIEEIESARRKRGTEEIGLERMRAQLLEDTDIPTVEVSIKAGNKFAVMEAFCRGVQRCVRAIVENEIPLEARTAVELFVRFTNDAKENGYLSPLEVLKVAVQGCTPERDWSAYRCKDHMGVALYGCDAAYFIARLGSMDVENRFGSDTFSIVKILVEEVDQMLKDSHRLVRNQQAN
jgi:hypothetical protein